MWLAQWRRLWRRSSRERYVRQFSGLGVGVRSSEGGGTECGERWQNASRVARVAMHRVARSIQRCEHLLGSRTAQRTWLFLVIQPIIRVLKDWRKGKRKLRK